MWIVDLIMSVLVFTAASIIAFTIIMNSFSTGSQFDDARKDAVKISEYLLSEGTPVDWNETNLVKPGFISYNRLNSTKAYKGMNMTNSTYDLVKSLLQLEAEDDFMAVFINSSGAIVPFQDYCSFGKPWTALDYDLGPPLDCQAVNFTKITYNNLIKIDRHLVYDSQIAKMEVYVWN